MIMYQGNAMLMPSIIYKYVNNNTTSKEITFYMFYTNAV